MSKADKMLLEQGFEMNEIKATGEGVLLLRYEDRVGGTITFGYGIKILCISFHHIDFKLWLAINEKIKELGW